MEKTITPANVLTWGIIAVAFCTCPVLGVIFAAIGLKKAKKYKNTVGLPSGMVKAGSIMSKIALPVSIVMQVVWVIYIIGIAAMVASYM